MGKQDSVLRDAATDAAAQVPAQCNWGLKNGMSHCSLSIVTTKREIRIVLLSPCCGALLLA